LSGKGHDSVALNQCDQMFIWKNRPKGGPNHIFSNKSQTSFCREEDHQSLTYLFNFKKCPKYVNNRPSCEKSPKMRKIVQREAQFKCCQIKQKGGSPKFGLLEVKELPKVNNRHSGEKSPKMRIIAQVANNHP
jgi:hypothetical protein